MLEPFSAIKDLQAKWHALKDLDRAKAIRFVHPVLQD